MHHERRTCYSVGDDLYYLGSDGVWLRVVDSPSTAMPVELQAAGTTAPYGARPAYDGSLDLVDAADRAHELEYQAEVRRLVEAYELAPAVHGKSGIFSRRYAAALRLDPLTACRIVGDVLDVAEDSAVLFRSPSLSVESAPSLRWAN